MRGAQETGAGMMNTALQNALQGALTSANIGNQFRLGEAQRQTQGSLGLTGALGNLFGEGQRAGLSAAQLSPTLTAGMTAPGEILGAVGGQQRGMEQANIDEAMRKYNYEQQLPFMKLAEFANQTRGPFGGVLSSEVQANPSSSQQAAQTLGLILSGANVAPEVIAAIRKILGI